MTQDMSLTEQALAARLAEEQRLLGELERVRGDIARLRTLVDASAPESNQRTLANALRGMTQHEALIALARLNGGTVRPADAGPIVLAAGISKTTDRARLTQQLYGVLERSERFEKSAPGTYRLIEDE